MMKKTKKTIRIALVFVVACFTIVGLIKTNISAQEPGALELTPTTQDTYIREDMVANMSQAEFLFESEITILYSIDGGDQHWDREDTDSVEAIQNFIDLGQLSIKEADWQAFKNLEKGIGAYSLEVTFYSKILEENGFVNPMDIESADISVVDDATSYDPNFDTTSGAVIRLKNFEYPLAQAQAVNETLIKTIPEGEFQAWDGTCAPVTVGNITLEPGKDLSSLAMFSNENIMAVQSATKTGAYSIKSEIMYLDDLIQTHKSMIYLTNEHTKVDHTNDVIVFADDFTITLEEAKVLTLDNAKQLGNVHAYEYSKGEVATGDITLELSDVNNATKSMVVSVPVTYTEQGTQVLTSVNVTIVGTDEEQNVPPIDEDTSIKENIKPQGGVPTGDTGNRDALALIAIISGFVLIGMKKYAR